MGRAGSHSNHTGRMGDRELMNVFRVCATFLFVAFVSCTEEPLAQPIKEITNTSTVSHSLMIPEVMVEPGANLEAISREV